MAQQKNPGSADTLRGTGRHTPAVSGAAYHNKQHADNDALWDECREALDADASRKAQVDAKLKAAGIGLCFAQDENHQWTKQCPHCGRRVWLLQTKNGEIHASSGCGPTCSAIPSIQRWLIDEGFQS